MGRKERLTEYWRKLRGLYHKADTKVIPIQNTFQRVTRNGIRVNGKEYCDDDLIFRYLGRMVNVVVMPDMIRVEDMDRKVIATFTPAQI